MYGNGFRLSEGYLANYNRTHDADRREGEKNRVNVRGGYDDNVVAVWLLVARLAKRAGQPLETLVETVTRRRASRLDVLYHHVS